MMHEQMDPVDNRPVDNQLASIIEAEAIRDYDWVQDFSAQAEAMFHHAPPLEIWVEAVRAAGEIVTPED